MNMFFVPSAMWGIFKGSFSNHIPIITTENRNEVMCRAKVKYKEIVHSIPTFQKNDILLVNILSAAMVGAVYLSLHQKATVEQMKEFYRQSMNDNGVVKLILKNTNHYSSRSQKKLAKEAQNSRRATNHYTWRYKFKAGKTLNSYDAVFDKCGICVLFKELGISEIVPAMCAYDYEMAKFTNTVFTRKYTIASGGYVCDCHYERKDAF